MIRKCLYLFITIVAISCAVGFAEDNPISYQLINNSGRIVIKSSDGKEIPWSCTGVAYWGKSLEKTKKLYEPFIKSGTTVYQVTVQCDQLFWSNPFSSLDGKPLKEPRTPIYVDKLIQWILEKNPDAYFFVRLNAWPDSKWKGQNLTEYGTEKGQPSIQPSFASSKYLKHMKQMLRDFVSYFEKQPWKNRIIGYVIFPYHEGGANHDGFFDHSIVMKKTFSNYVKKKYKTEDALRKAWYDPSVTFSNLNVPSDEDWFAKKKRLNIMHWPDPRKIQRELDYFQLRKILYHYFWNGIFDTMLKATEKRPVIKAYDTFKQYLQGWMLSENFHARWKNGAMDNARNWLLIAGSTGIGPLLDHKGIDMIQAPGMYFNRAMGYASEAEGLTDTLTLRNKVNYMEADLRTWHLPRHLKKHKNYTAGAFMNTSEVQAGFDRQLAWALSRNQMFYYLSLSSFNQWFMPVEIQAVIKKQTDILKTSFNKPFKDIKDAIAIIIDDESGLYEDFSTGFQHLAVFKQIEEGLALCGVPYRIYLLSDLGKDNFPDYKCYLFPNLFKVDDETMKLLKKKVLRNGNVAIFGPGTGINDGEKISSLGAEKIFGIPFDVIQKRTNRRVILQNHGSPISDKLNTTTYGDSFSYGPLLVPKDQRLDNYSDAKALGSCFYYFSLDRVGPFVKDFGLGAVNSGKTGKRGEHDYSVVFSPAVPIPPELLRECCRYAGCNIWSEKNNVIYASSNFVALHTVRCGKQTIHLPGKYNVTDMNTGKEIAKNTDKIDVISNCPETFLFRISPAN